MRECGVHAIVIILEFGALIGVFGCGVEVALDHDDALQRVVGVFDLLALGVDFVVERAVGVVVVRGRIDARPSC